MQKQNSHSRTSGNLTKRILTIGLIVLGFNLLGPAIIAGTMDTHENNSYVAYAEPTADEKATTEEATEKAPAEGTPAETDDKATPLANIEQVTDMVSFIISFQGFINRMIWPVLLMIGGLLDNSLLFGNGMAERLRDIWIPIRNIVNIMFVLALVAIALYNVLGIGEEGGNYSLKSILPKLIIGIIVVNFSFLGMKVFLDVINVGTVSIFSLPDQVSEGLSTSIEVGDEKDAEIVKRFCALVQGLKIKEIDKTSTKEIKIKAKTIFAGNIARELGYKKKLSGLDPDKIRAAVQSMVNADDKLNAEAKAKVMETYDKEMGNREKGQICNGYELSDFAKKMGYDKFGTKGAALAFVLNMSQMVFYEDLPLELENWEKMLTTTLFSLMLYIIYMASFLALFIVLLARLVVLWLAIALSPILLLGMVIPVVKEKITGFGEIQDTFVQNAIAPIGIALAMTIGWIMLRAIQGLNKFDTMSALNVTEGSIPLVGLSTLQDIVVALGTVAIVWLGVFAAADKSIAKGVTGAIKGGLAKAGSWAALTPLKHTAIIPIKLPGKEVKEYSLGQVQQVFKNVDRHQAQNIDDLSKDIGLTGTTSNDIRNAKDPDIFINLLSDSVISDKLGKADKDTVEDVLTWARNNDNKLKALEGSGEKQEFTKAIRALQEAVTNNDEDKIKEASKALKSYVVKNGKPVEKSDTAKNPGGASTQSKGASTGTPPATAPPVQITNDTTLGGAKIGEEKAKKIKPKVDKIHAEETEGAAILLELRIIKTELERDLKTEDLPTIIGTGDKAKGIFKKTGNGNEEEGEKKVKEALGITEKSTET